MKHVKLFESFGDNSPYEKLAKSIFDIIDEFDSTKYVSRKEAEDIDKYFSNEDNGDFDNPPHKEKYDKCLLEFNKFLKTKLPKLNNEAIEACAGTFLETHFGGGVSYSSELNALTSRLKKTKTLEDKQDNENSTEEPGTEEMEGKAEYPWLTITFGSDQTNGVNNILDALKKEGHIRNIDHKPAKTGNGLTYLIQFYSVYAVYLFGWHQAKMGF
jgi:hypothetical protein